MRTSLGFIFLAACCLICGVSLGIYMGMIHDFSLAPVHAHLNLLGWVSLALFGLTYRAFPELDGKLARTHLAVSGFSGVAFPLAIYLATAHESRTLVSIAAPLWLLGALLFVANLGRLALRR
jgi:hypothetical protein